MVGVVVEPVLDLLPPAPLPMAASTMTTTMSQNHQRL